MTLEEYFLKLRFDKNHHLGCGDIRLTLGQQDELLAMFGTRPEARDTDYENLRQRCLKLGDLHPGTKGSIGDIWAAIYKRGRESRQPAAELAVGYLAEFIDHKLGPQERTR